MQKYTTEEAHHGALAGYILDQFLIDAFNPKTGSEKDIIVLTFIVTRKSAALRLCVFIKQGDIELMDVEASPDPGEEGDVLVFVEMSRDREIYKNICELLGHIEYLVNKREWYFKPYPHNQFIEFNRENFFNTVQQYSEEKQDRQPEVRKPKPFEFASQKELGTNKENDFSDQEYKNLFRSLKKNKKQKTSTKSTLKDYLIPGKNLEPTQEKISSPKKTLKSKEETNKSPKKIEKPEPKVQKKGEINPQNIKLKDIPRKEYSYIKPLLGEFKELKKVNKRLNSHLKYLESVKLHLNRQIEIEQERQKNILLRENQNHRRIKQLEAKLNPIS